MRNALRAFFILLLAIMVLCSWIKPIDSTAIQQIDTGLNRALISYASARALNAVISVAQGTEVAIEPGGLGVVFTPGQALEPINDLVEHFSTLMLIACIAFGVQKILINVGGYWLISLLLTFVTIGWAWLYYRQLQPPSWLSRLLIILLMIRFAIPMVTIGTDLLFQKFLAADYQASQQVIDSASSQVTEIKLPDPAPPADQGFIDKMKGKVNDLLSQAKAAVDAKSHYLKLKQTAEQWAEHIIRLIVIFLLQTLIIPVLLIWILYAVARGTFEFPVKRAN